jgi:cytochrome c oxidase subunit II
MDERRTFLRLAVVWLVLSVIAVLLIVFALGPHMPPGRVSAQSSDQTTANIFIASFMAPIVLAVWIVFGYAIRNFRQRGPQIEDGPPDRGEPRIQSAWLVTTIIIVLFLAVYGSYGLLSTAEGAGGGQGPSPLVKPPGTPLVVQVIGQQWAWTYRWPSYGGVETRQLEVPVGQLIAFHVTSLDVVHSFWAIGLGVKADAVPGTDNVAFVTPKHTNRFEIRCAELCGLWHSQMANHGYVVSRADFDQWIAGQQRANAPTTKVLPPYSQTYFPDPQRRAG